MDNNNHHHCPRKETNQIIQFQTIYFRLFKISMRMIANYRLSSKQNHVYISHLP